MVAPVLKRKESRRVYRYPIRGLYVICPKCGRPGYLVIWRGAPRVVHRVDLVGKRKIAEHSLLNYEGELKVVRGSHEVDPDDPIEVLPYPEKLPTFIRFPGADSTIVRFLLKMMPPHKCYVEVFGGSAKLLLTKTPSKVEVYNDIDGDLVNLFEVVRNRKTFQEFLRRTKYLVYSRELYYKFIEKLKRRDFEDDVERAVALYYVHWATVGGKRGSGFSAGPKSNVPRAFFNALKGINLIHERLKNVCIECLDFRECIRKYDSEYTFFYLDPPHVFLSSEKERDFYEATDRFTEEDFMDLLEILSRVKGKWLLKHHYLPSLDRMIMESLKPHRVLLRYRRNVATRRGREGEWYRSTGKYAFYANYRIGKYTLVAE